MSIRRFNFTERQRIAHQDVAIYLSENSDSRSFDAAFDWRKYTLPAQAPVIVEAYRQTTVRRYSFGRVANTSAEEATVLEGFGNSDGVLFRIKVVDADGSGRLLAEADKLHPSDPKSTNRRSLIRVADADLGGELWRLSFDDGEPLLEIEQSFARESLLNSFHFQCLVYPQILRETLRAALDEGFDDDEGDASWQAKFISFGERLARANAPDVDSTGLDNVREEWITSAVTAFCKRHRVARKYADVALTGGTEE